MKEIVKEVSTYCKEILTGERCSSLPFHNLTHTEEVVDGVKKICKNEGIVGNDREILIISAWFHDTGLVQKYAGHEEVSISLVKDFLQTRDYPEGNIEQIVKCIGATKLPQNPTTQLAEVLCDADLFHVSTPNFFYRKLLLRKEWETELGTTFTDLEWHHVNHDFLRNHQYFTEYGKKVLAKGQDKNILKVENLIKMCSPDTPSDGEGQV
ncbi:HD domain-containing protein [Ekhidna sp.]|uniref:HD domain-containing protein n=1 Tax=Ekhidna sp. TaxID=2608089 RepID=UPI003296ADEB